MKTFTDSADREWTISINVAAIKRVRDLAGVDLLEVLDGSLIEKLIRDPVLLCDVVYAVCKPEADGRGINDEDFGRAMTDRKFDSRRAGVMGLGGEGLKLTRVSNKRTLESVLVTAQSFADYG